MSNANPREDIRKRTPLVENDEQRDFDKQAQTVAAEVLAGCHQRDPSAESRKADAAADAVRPDDAPDLIDHMNQMISSGHIDMAAYRGERSDDDDEDELGESGLDDDEPRGAP